MSGQILKGKSRVTVHGLTGLGNRIPKAGMRIPSEKRKEVDEGRQNGYNNNENQKKRSLFVHDSKDNQKNLHAAMHYDKGEDHEEGIVGNDTRRSNGSCLRDSCHG